MRILVQKFGGTSVADLACMSRVREKVKKGLDGGCKVVAVLSARAGETNRLLALADEWSPNPDPAECDSLLSTGEQVSVSLFAMLLRDMGIRARSVLGFQAPVLTTEDHGKARIRSIDPSRLLALLREYDVLVMAGFQGITPSGRISTLGRGGSDTSAVAVAAVLKAELCEIYTDVDGVYTTDPNIVSSARKLDRITYDEMLEMASMGAKVLEIRSVEFAKKYAVPVHVLSTFADAPGTMLIQEEKKMEHALLSGVALDKDQARITLRSCPDRPGVSAGIFAPLAQAGIIVDMIVQNPSLNGVTDVTFTVSRKDVKKALAAMEELRAQMPGMEVLHDANVCKVSLIGVGMRNHSGIASRAFSAISRENINILIISTSEIKISCLLEEKYGELAVRTLHDAFELGKSSSNGAGARA
ncbi:MAG: aspartate kinase [Deltaproteobacteria bacterium]|jgi:aspartate kinase|nr:aspartate kinase [Deltaproteobacteria bacterium]